PAHGLACRLGGGVPLVSRRPHRRGRRAAAASATSVLMPAASASRPMRISAHRKKEQKKIDNVGILASGSGEPRSPPPTAGMIRFLRFRFALRWNQNFGVKWVETVWRSSRLRRSSWCEYVTCSFRPVGRVVGVDSIYVNLLS